MYLFSETIMGLPLGCRYLSVLQVAIIAICYRGKVSCEREQGCVGSKLSLKCEEMKVINIKAVVLGDSFGYGSVCFITDNACTHNANANHTMNVHRRCDYKHNCSVGVIQEKIPCGYLGYRSNNDFERITYDCIDDPRNDTTMDSTYDDSTEDDFKLGFGTEIAQGCVGSQVSLSCQDMKVIEIIDVVIGDSYGVSTACNMSDSNCTQIANANHTIDVHHRCDDQSSCIVPIIREKINCGSLSWRIYNDIELITYNCLNNSRSKLTYYLTSTHGTVTATHISNSTEAGAATEKPNSHMQTIVIVITCSIILLVIILVIVVMYRRKKGAQVKTPLDPVAMTDVDNNCQNEYDICSNETHGTSLHDYGYAHVAQQMYSQIDESDSPEKDENQTIYSEVELRETIWEDSQTTGQTKAAAVQSSTHLETGTVSKSLSFEDDGGQTVIENDLYGMADNCAKDTAVESPTRSLAGAVSKTPSSQDDEGLTVIENDIYCH